VTWGGAVILSSPGQATIVKQVPGPQGDERVATKHIAATPRAGTGGGGAGGRRGGGVGDVDLMGAARLGEAGTLGAGNSSADASDIHPPLLRILSLSVHAELLAAVLRQLVARHPLWPGKSILLHQRHASKSGSFTHRPTSRQGVGVRLDADWGVH